MLPVTCTCEPEAKIKFDLDAFDVPLPTMNADCADDSRLYCPCTCWFNPDAIVPQPSACE